MATENVKSRKAYRILTDPINKIWDRINFLTNAESVDSADGKNLETKVGAIDGITSDLNGESDNIAASIKCVKGLNDSLAGGKVKFSVESDGAYVTYNAGADTVKKKLGSGELTQLYEIPYWNATFVENSHVVTGYDKVLIEFDSYTDPTLGAISVSVDKGNLKELSMSNTLNPGLNNARYISNRYILENANGATITFKLTGTNYVAFERVYGMG